MSILSLWFYIFAFVHISTFIAISADDFFCLLTAYYTKLSPASML